MANMRKITRREFIKGVASTGALVYVSGLPASSKLFLTRISPAFSEWNYARYMTVSFVTGAWTPCWIWLQTTG